LNAFFFKVILEQQKYNKKKK